MKPIKHIAFLMSLLFIMASCGEYQKVLKENEVAPKKKLATKYYEEGKEKDKKSRFKRAVRLFEQILPRYRGKPQGERIAFMNADSYYQMKDYYDAAYQFERFQDSYGNSQKMEEAAFKEAKSYYHLSPRYSLDQEETEKGLEKFQKYISKYPDGDHIGDANEMVSDLRHKLEKKDFKIAKLYYDQDDYKATIATMNNFIDENPGSSFREKAYYYRLDASYELAVHSFYDVMKGRLDDTKKYANDYEKYYPEGDYVDEVDKIAKDVKYRLKDTKFEITLQDLIDGDNQDLLDEN